MALVTMQVLVLCDDYWHPARTAREGLKPIEQDNMHRFKFDWIEDAADWSEERMMKYSLIILTKSNNVSSRDQTHWATPEVEAAFQRHLQAGNGLVVIHSGIADYREQRTLRGLMGGAFASHPDQCPVTVTAKAGNPLGAASIPFTVFDEHYMMDLDDTEANVFLTTSSEHGTQPAGWSRTEGPGRVCVLTPGHNLEVWLHPAYQDLIQRALAWCGKLE
jgi:type 1 glutamine amidotransferase